MPGRLPSPRHALSRRLLPLAYALGAVIAVVMLLTWIALRTQVSLAGFLNGESVWSTAEKQAIISLDYYAESGEPAALEQFQRSYGLLQSDRWGRDAVMKPTYDAQKVSAAFARGDVMASAQSGMIFILRHLAWAPYVRQALSDWRSSDRSVNELGAVSAELRAAYAAGGPSPQLVASARARIRAIDSAISPLSANFSVSVAEGAQWSGGVLFAGILGAGCVACVLWLWMARRVLASIRGSEERYRLLFDSAPDAIVMVSETTGRIVDANRTTGVWAGRRPDELPGTLYANLFESGAGDAGEHGPAALRKVRGASRLVETQSSVAAWGDQFVRQTIMRDVSERVANDRDRRIASEALASIAEGIMIADPERRLLSVNAAAPQITGFAAHDLVGMRLDDTRRLPDGSPLPASFWEHIAKAHHWSGEVLSTRKDGSTYCERLAISTIRDAAQRILHYVAVFSDVSDIKADHQRLEQMAMLDALTGLTNRAEFQRRCDAEVIRAAAAHETVVVLFIDLDAFKFVNDSYSHAVGDRLLRQVAERILGQLGEGDTAGRIGGDEFTVLLPNLALREDAAAVADRLLSVLSEPFHVDGYEIAISASIGIAGFPLDGSDAVTLVANADAAMYAAKTEERNVWRFYVPMMQADARHRMSLATELRQALENDEFRVVYQPSVEIQSGRVVGAEALLRWQHPEHGEILPGEFIAVAEGIGLIQRIDSWVMQAVCAQIHAWDESGMPAIRVAINVSARWFGHPGFVQGVRHALQMHRVAPDRVVLEITEGAMLRLGEETERTMRSLNAMGVRVAIDDFGTGYASMAYLKLPAVAYLKVDQSFIRGLPGDSNDAAITTAMLAMAGSLGLATIAEGIETEAQHEFLLKAGCAEGQGFLYSYPLPAAALERMLLPKRQPAGSKLKLVPPARG